MTLAIVLSNSGTTEPPRENPLTEKPKVAPDPGKKPAPKTTERDVPQGTAHKPEIHEDAPGPGKHGDHEPEHVFVRRPEKKKPRANLPERPDPNKTRPTVQYSSVRFSDLTGVLSVRHGRESGWSSLSSFGTVGISDRLRSGTRPASFVVAGAHTMLLDRNTQVNLARGTDGFALISVTGRMFLESRTGSTWTIAAGDDTQTLKKLKGRIAVEANQETMTLLVLDGSCILETDQGPELLAAGEIYSTIHMDVREKTRAVKALRHREKRINKLWPEALTQFQTTLDDPAGFSLSEGKIVEGGEGSTGHVLVLTPRERTDSRQPAYRAAAIRLPAEFAYARGLKLRVRYRTRNASFHVRFGKFTKTISVTSPGRWSEAIIHLSRSEDEGVPIIHGDPFREIGFRIRDGKSMEIDSVQLFRKR